MSTAGWRTRGSVRPEARVDRDGHLGILDGMNEASEPRFIDPYVRLAAAAIRARVVDGRTLEPPADVPEAMRGPAGTFVSIKKHGKLRGCIGTFAPTEPSIAHEVIANAIKSATSDPRFPPVDERELGELSISVDVLSPPEACGFDDLDPARYGVIVESGWRRGLLLPDLPGVDRPEQQVDIARRKAGISPHEPISLQRFTVERHV